MLSGITSAGEPPQHVPGFLLQAGKNAGCLSESLGEQFDVAVPSVNSEVTNTRKEVPAIDNVPPRQGKEEEETNRLPMEWSRKEKYIIVFWLYTLTVAVNVNGAGFAPIANSAAEDLKTSKRTLLIGNAFYFASQGVAPLLLAPLSERQGRRTIYTISGAIFCVLYIPQGLAGNAAMWIWARILQGCAGSVVEANVGGSLADLYVSSERGPILAAYVAVNYIGTGLGPLLAAGSATRGWRCQAWTAMGLAFFAAIGLLIYGRETRASKYCRLSRERPPSHETLESARRVDSNGETSETSLVRSLARPVLYLVTEPIVIIFSVWIGFTFGMCYLVIESAYVTFEAGSTKTPSITTVRDGYSWSTIQTSAALLAYVAGALIGLLTNVHQEALYQRVAKGRQGEPTPPEARLSWSLVGGVTFAVACVWYAFAVRPGVHPAAAVIALVFVVAGVFPIHCASFAYLADTYERYASSAIAGQTLVRTTAAGCFPLFADDLYLLLTPPLASGVLGAVAALLTAVPLVLMRYGPALRARSQRN